MKRLAALLTVLLLLPQMAPAAAVTNLEGLDAMQLEALRVEADARLRLLQLPDANGYLDVLDGEAYAREPQKHLNEKIRMDGVLLSAEETDGGISYFLSLDSKPERVFLVLYTLSPDERLPLPGDAVSAYGVFEGLSPFTGQDELTSGAPRLRADLVIPRLPAPVKPAADGHAGTREDPAPLNVKAEYAGSWWTDYAGFELEAVQSWRGNAALKKAKDLSPYNITPPRNQEFFVVELRVRALSAPSGRAPIAAADFFFVSEQGAEYRQHFLINAPHELRTLYAEGEHTAILACLIDKGDRPLLVFQPESDSPLWFDPNPAP